MPLLKNIKNFYRISLLVFIFNPFLDVNNVVENELSNENNISKLIKNI
jgi:hypothetical protein